MMIFEGVIVQQLLTTTELKAAQKKFDLGMIDFICYNLSLMQAFITNDIEKDKQRMKDETTSSENGKKEAKLLAENATLRLRLEREKAERQIQQENADKDKQQMFQRLAAMEASIQNSNNAPVQPIMQQSAQSGNQFSVNNQQVQAFAGQQVQHAYNNSSQPVLGPQHFILVILNCKPL